MRAVLLHHLYQHAASSGIRRRADYAARLAQQVQPRAAKAAPAESTEIEFFVDPKAAVSRALDSHPLVREMRQAAQESRESRSRQQFAQSHPDAATVLADPQFRAWVTKSPVRRALLKQAHEKFDTTAAEEIFGTWKQLRGK